MDWKKLARVPALFLALAFLSANDGCTLRNPIPLTTIAILGVENPISPTTMAQLEVTYQAAEKLIERYRTECYSIPLTQMSPSRYAVCKNRRQILRVMWSAGDKAYAALATARGLPDRININAAINAMNRFIAVVETNKVPA